MKPSDEPFRKGETRYTVFRVFVSYIFALGIHCSIAEYISLLESTNTMHETLSIIFVWWENYTEISESLEPKFTSHECEEAQHGGDKD